MNRDDKDETMNTNRPNNQPQTLDLGNNESLVRGVFPQPNGEWLAITFTQSKVFKTERGARDWFARKTAR